MEQTPKPIPNLFGTSFDGIITGIYKITSPSGKIYVGEAKNIFSRWKQYSWKNGGKKQTLLYNSFEKYGKENHNFEIIHVLDTDGDFIEWIHRPLLYYYECFFIQQFKDNGNIMLNLTDGGRKPYYTDQYGKKIYLRKPKFIYTIRDTNSFNTYYITNIAKFVEDYCLTCSKRLESSLYGYDIYGITCHTAKGFKLISKTYVDNEELDIFLQKRIKNEKINRYNIRKSFGRVDMGSKEQIEKLSNIVRPYEYECLDIENNVTFFVPNVSQFCKKYDIKCQNSIIDTYYGITKQGNVVSHCKGFRFINKRYKDLSKDCEDIILHKRATVEKRMSRRKNMNKTCVGSSEFTSKRSEASSTFDYIINKKGDDDMIIVNNLREFFINTIGQHNVSSNLYDTLYGYKRDGGICEWCREYKIVEKHYIDKNLDDDKLQEEIKNEILKRKILNNLIPKDGYKVLHIESNDIKTVPNMAEFCEQNKLVPNYLLKTYKFPTYQHRGYRLVEKFTYYSDVNNPFEK